MGDPNSCWWRFSRFLANFLRTPPKTVFYRIPDLVLIYTPKEAHSRIFVTGGSVIFARHKGCKKSLSWGGKLVLFCHIKTYLPAPVLLFNNKGPSWQIRSFTPQIRITVKYGLRSQIRLYIYAIRCWGLGVLTHTLIKWMIKRPQFSSWRCCRRFSTPTPAERGLRSGSFLWPTVGSVHGQGPVST